MTKELLTVLAATFVATATPARRLSAQSDTASDQSQAVRRIAGCYAITLGAWSGQNYGVPPEHFVLDTAAQVKPPRTYGHVVLPASLAGHSSMPAFWHPRGADSVRIVWSTGYTGVVLLARAEGDSLTGRARAFHDFHRTGEPPDAEAPFVARRERCGVAR